jgi:hypothetical protein
MSPTTQKESVLPLKPYMPKRDLSYWLGSLFATYKIFHDDFNSLPLWDSGKQASTFREYKSTITLKIQQNKTRKDYGIFLQ